MFLVDFARMRLRHGAPAWPQRAHVGACAGRKLPARRLAPLQCRPHFAEREIEYIVQQESGPLKRRQPVQRQE